MMNRPDKTMRITHQGRTFIASLYAKEDRMVIADAASGLDLAAFSPINELSIGQLQECMRKCARFFMGIDRDYSKFRQQGYEFLITPRPGAFEEADARRPAKPQKEEKKHTISPRWMQRA